MILSYCRALGPLEDIKALASRHPLFSCLHKLGRFEARRAMAATVDAITGTVDETALLAAHSQVCERM